MSNVKQDTPETTLVDDEEEVVSGRADLWRRLTRQRLAMVSLIYLVGLSLLAIFAPLIAFRDPLEQDLLNVLLNPGWEFWLGTDNLGRDTLSRIIFGSQATLLASILGVGTALAIGLPVGLLAGYLGGTIDRAIMWINDLILSLPALVVTFAIIAILSPGLVNAMLATGIVLSTRYVRLTRGVLLAEREKTYVEAARVAGISTIKILIRHILPNIASPLIVQTSLFFGIVILIEASLSFLGLGAPVGMPSWGRMLNEARLYFGLQPFLAFPPGIAITLTVLAFNLLGDGLRDVMGKDIKAGRIPVSRLIKDESRTDVSINKDSLNGGWALSIRALEVRFPSPKGGQMSVIQDISLGVRPRETLGLVGESGSGKSMTALSALGLIPFPGQIKGGSVCFDGQELIGLSKAQWQTIRGNKIAMIFQEPLSALNPALTVGDQICEPLRFHKSLTSSEARERATQLLSLVRVPDSHRRLDEYPHQYSGGMAQRAVIARALACNPQILIADEPTTALDVSIQGQVLDLLRDLQEKFGMAMLFITHNMGVAADVCDRVAVMYAGQIIEIAHTDELMEMPRHPYTSALLGAMPQNRRRSGHLTNIKGQVPQPWAWPKGCRFHPRCDYAINQCEHCDIDLAEVAPNHLARCLRSSEYRLWGKS
jgi:peptide/nickel transport system permease protein